MSGDKAVAEGVAKKDESDELVKTIRHLICDNRRFLEHLDADEPDGDWDDPGEGEEEPLPSV